MNERDAQITTAAPTTKQPLMSIESLESASSFWAIGSLILTGVLAVSGALAWYFSDRASSAKDERLKLEMASANARGAEANEKAARANERAAVLESAAAAARLELEQLKAAQAPRRMSKDQEDEFRRVLSSAKKRPVRVICHTGKEEAKDWGRQIRGLLDALGFSDPMHAEPEVIIGMSISTTNKETTHVGYHSKEECLQDFVPENNYSNVQNAFRYAGIPCGAVVSSLGQGEIAVIIVDK